MNVLNVIEPKILVKIKNKRSKSSINIQDSTDSIYSNSDKLYFNKKSNNNNNRSLFKTHTMMLDTEKILIQNSKFDLILDREQRKDIRGVPILKGSKSHKVSFIDKIGTRNLPLVQRIDIESYKAQNAFNSFRDENRNKSNSSISCCFLF
jgi:hypothetical protein